jgi:putative phage-type endonuclease
MAKISREDFLLRRKSGLGGSDMAAVMGFSKFRTALDVYNDKTTDDIDLTPNDILDLASFLEDYTAKKFASLHECRVTRVNGELVHPKYPFLKGNIDRKITGMQSVSGAGILECKALSTYNFRNVELYGLPYDYIIQMQFYFAIGRGTYQWGRFAILNRDNGKLLTFEVFPDQTLMDAIESAGVDFWENHVIKNIPPESNQKENQITPLPTGGKVEILNDDIELTALLNQYKEYSNIKKEADALVNDVKERITTRLQGHTAVECANMRIYTSTATRHTIDTQKLKKEQSAIYYKYLKATESNSLKIYNLSK